MKIIDNVNKYWPIIIGTGTLVSIAFSFFYQFYSLKYTVESNSHQLEEERYHMRQYVDYKDKATNIRIDNVTVDVSKIHEDLTKLASRIDNIHSEISNQIQQSRSEQNERIDQLILIMNSKGKR